MAARGGGWKVPNGIPPSPPSHPPAPPDASRDPARAGRDPSPAWVPACAGMSGGGIHRSRVRLPCSSAHPPARPDACSGSRPGRSGSKPSLGAGLPPAWSGGRVQYGLGSRLPSLSPPAPLLPAASRDRAREQVGIQAQPGCRPSPAGAAEGQYALGSGCRSSAHPPACSDACRDRSPGRSGSSRRPVWPLRAGAAEGSTGSRVRLPQSSPPARSSRRKSGSRPGKSGSKPGLGAGLRRHERRRDPTGSRVGLPQFPPPSPPPCSRAPPDASRSPARAGWHP